jgi:nucleoside-diphosphate-sugar epimerase
LREDFRETRVLVTGGAGFIGSWLVETLINQGASVRVLDNFRSGSTDNLMSVLNSIELIRGDMREYETVRNSLQGVEVIFHLAANASVPLSTETPDYDFSANALGTYNLLKAMRQDDIEAVAVYTSSAAVYGEPARVPIDELHELNPVSFYGASKMAGEAYCRAFYHLYGMKTVILRLFNTYGPRQPRYVMHDLLKKISQNREKLEILGTGKEQRDFTYVTDCVNAVLLAATCPNATGHAINIGSGEAATIEKTAQIILEHLGLWGKTKVVYTGRSWKGDVRTLMADIALARSVLKYEPTVRLEQGLRTLIDYFFREAGEVTK